MTEPKNIGNIAEMCVIAEFVKNDIPVSLPFGDNQPYDIVIDTKMGFKSVQVKNGSLKNGSITVDIRKRIGAKRINYTTYNGLVDFIAVWCDDTNECYLLDINECGEQLYIVFRIAPPKNNSCNTKIRWAKNYLLKDKVLSFKK